LAGGNKMKINKWYWIFLILFCFLNAGTIDYCKLSGWLKWGEIILFGCLYGIVWVEFIEPKRKG
jgi:hypothetical protein